MKPSEKIKICPECHSSKIKKDWNLMGTIYKCEECGYKGVLILEISKEKIEKLNRKDLNNRKKHRK